MHYRSLLLAGAAATLATYMSGSAFAADATSSATIASGQGIAEVTVTARKKAESLQKVPVAITAQSGSELHAKSIFQLNDMERDVPSLQIESPAGTDSTSLIALRGQVSSDVLLGVSQPTGLYEDGVNIPHPVAAQNAFFDLTQVEVLKGPQGTLYGRNTTGGAITVTTKGADYNGFHGFAEGEVGNFRDYKASFAINLPLVADKLALRLAYQHWSQDGFGHSIVTGQKFGNDHDDDLVRASLKFEPAANFDAVLKVEYGRTHHTAAMTADVFSSPTNFTALASEALWSNFAVNAPIVGAAAGGDPVAFGKLIGIGGALLAPCVGMGLYTNCSGTQQRDDSSTWHGALDMKWRINDAITLRSITGVHYFTNTRIFDLDGLQAQVLEVGYGQGGLQPDTGFTAPYPLKPDETSTQWSQEFNLTGKAFNNNLDWLLGAFGSWDNGHGAQNSNAVNELITLFYGSPQYMGSHDGLKNTTNTYAFFTQEDYHFTKQISLTLGGRYTHEYIKQILASWNYYPALSGGTYLCTEPGTLPPPQNNPAACAQNPQATGPNGLFQSATSHGFSYLASLNFQLTDDVLMYLKTSRGFRGGAFGRSDQVPAKPETDTDYEFGFKGDFFEHRVRADLAIYDTEYNNKQESAAICSDGKTPDPAKGCSSGTFSTILINAAKARIRGVEFEGQVRPTRGLSFYGEFSYTHSVYLDFPGALTAGGSPIPTYNGGNAAGLPTGTGPNYLVPKWQGDIGGRYEMPIGPGVAAIQADYSYRGAIPITPLSVDPNIPLAQQQSINSAVGLVNGRIEYRLPSKGLTMSLWATNLTNKAYGLVGLVSTYTAGVGTEAVSPPRTFGFTVHLAFGE